MGNYGMEEEITTVSLVDLEGKLDLDFIGSLGIKDPEVVPYSFWKEFTSVWLRNAEIEGHLSFLISVCRQKSLP